jgi:hypothetical protein
MTPFADACRTSARHCAEIADKTCTLEDRSEFLSFAATWQRLANEIECNERLITLIDDLASSASANEDSGRKVGELTEYGASTNSLRRLATAILSVSNHYMAATADGIEEPESV